MATYEFTPPTYEVRFPADVVAEQYGVVGLTKRLVGVQRPYWVYITDTVGDGNPGDYEATPAPGTGPSQDLDAAAVAGEWMFEGSSFGTGLGHYDKSIFEGGRTYTVDGLVVTALLAAGYVSYMEVVS
jgi:hypothetical protein